MKKHFLWLLILSLLCLWVVAGADEPANQTNLDEIEKERLYEQQKLALEKEMQANPETQLAEEEARRVAEKIRLTEEMNLMAEQAEALKDERDDPPTILVTGDDCTDPLIITLPADLPYSDLSQYTCGRVDDYDQTCLDYYDGGEDIIYEVTVTSAVDVEIILDPKGTTWSAMLIDDTCPAGGIGECINTASSSGSELRIMQVHLEPGTYYIMVDTWPSPDCISDFDLTISTYVPPTGRCCYGDPYNPDCVDNVTEDECLAGYSGTWTEGLDCGIACPVPPANDDCENAELVAVPSSTQGNTELANGETFPLCGTGDGAPGVWYKVIGTGNSMTATTCNAYTDYDTKLRVYCHTCADPYCVGGNDDTSGAPPECDLNGLNRKSTVVWCSEVGTEYLIQVFGFSSYVGNFQLDVSDDGTPCQDPPLCAPPTGACCVYPECVDTNTWEECDAIEGSTWYAGEDCATFECPPPSDVPTLSEWGMIIFTLLLLSVGTVAVIRRRNTVSVKEAARS